MDDRDQRIIDLESRIYRLEAILEMVMDMAGKHPFTAKFVRKIKCELQR